MPLTPAHLRYYERLIDFDRRGAVAVAEDYLAGGRSVVDLFADVLDPCLLHTGKQWQVDQISVAHEHYISQVTLELIRQYGPGAWVEPSPQAPVVIACGVPGERHSIGLSMIADVFRAAGLVVHMLGEGLPAEAIASLARQVRADLLSLSCALDIHLPDAVDLIVYLKQAEPSLGIVLGGAALRGRGESFARRLGADFTASDARQLQEQLPIWLTLRGLMAKDRCPGSTAVSASPDDRAWELARADPEAGQP